LPQDFADYLGWKEITEKAEQFYQTLPAAQRDSTFIYCRHYGLAGALKYYGKDDLFKEKVISDNGSFLAWIPNDFGFKHLIFVGRKMRGNDEEMFQHFKKITIIDSVTYPHSRQLGDKIIFFENVDSVGSKLAADEVKQMKQQFNY
jgi:hypothetical protein